MLERDTAKAHSPVSHAGAVVPPGRRSKNRCRSDVAATEAQAKAAKQEQVCVRKSVSNVMDSWCNVVPPAEIIPAVIVVVGEATPAGGGSPAARVDPTQPPSEAPLVIVSGIAVLRLPFG